jgi:hypothetical protein
MLEIARQHLQRLCLSPIQHRQDGESIVPSAFPTSKVSE